MSHPTGQSHSFTHSLNLLVPIKLNITKKEKGGGELQSDRCVNIEIVPYMHSHKPNRMSIRTH